MNGAIAELILANHLSSNDRHGIMPYSEEGINTKENPHV